MGKYRVIGAGVLLVCMAVGFLGIEIVGDAQASAVTEKIRWDIISLENGDLPAQAGGVAFALANDQSSIRLSGSGSFGPTVFDSVSGGGDWTTFDPAGNETGTGTYVVTGLISYVGAPGNFPVPEDMDLIGNPEDARAGLAHLSVVYSDGSSGVLVVSCRLVESPETMFEGVINSKDFVSYSNYVPNVAGIDANRTVFHAVP